VPRLDDRVLDEGASGLCNAFTRELRERHDFDGERLEHRPQLLKFAGIAGRENDTHARA
jgi:hypothetical protein